ncbi:MAG TPA: hypothetical protein VGP19_13395 [Candidatus Acidoferrales bacterium]|nr:hypothetical protein [Candidatus Acidoferrales bacterium]
MVRSSFRFAMAALLAFVFCACWSVTSPSARVASVQAAPKSDAASIQKLELKYDKAVVGAKVRVTSEGLPAGETVELKWSTVTGGWVVEDDYYFRGRKYSETSRSLGKFPVGAGGRLEATFVIPEDYGGVHDVIATLDGKVVAQNGIEVTQSFEMSPTSGPVGTPIELRVKGLGWRPMENTWVVNWDNRGTGFVTAAGTHGSAIARFRAAGPAGDHFVKIYTGWQGQSYLNFQQAPNAYLPRPDFTFRTTSGASSTRDAYADEYQPYSLPEAEAHVANGKLSLTPIQGPVGTEATLRGEGFPANSTLDLLWQTYVGSRVSGNGFGPQENLVAKVKVGNDGTIEFPLKIPEDLGGEHGIELRDGERSLGRAYYAIETTIVSMAPTSGPAGTPVTIHLKGVGWTEYDNMYAATYDNAYMGYACGFNTQGDVVITFKAAGEPGSHLIDLFPGIYQGPPTENQLLYRMPQLTYADDHPGNKIPALHFKFDVTP